MESLENNNKPSDEVQIDTSVPAAPKYSDISTSCYISCEISVLMPLVTEDLSNHETNLYLNAAVQFAKESKEAAKGGDFGKAVNMAEKAVKRIERLCSIRTEKEPDFIILKAPFYFLMGNAIITYVECTTDVFGNVAPIQEQEDSDEADSEGEEEEGDASDAEGAKDQGPVKDNNNQEEEKTAQSADVEPRIEDEEEKKQTTASAENGEDANKNDQQEDYAGQLCDDAYENLEIGIQIVEAFLENPEI